MSPKSITLMMVASQILLPLQHNLKMLKRKHVSAVVWVSVLSLQLISVSAIPQTLELSEHHRQRQRQQHTEVAPPTREPAAFGDNYNDTSTKLKQQQQHGLRRLERRLKSSKLPEFHGPIGNVTAVMGRDVRLICTVENLGQYQGFYQCQVNTSPMRSTSGYLEVVVPPTIIESQSTRVAEVVEHSDVGLQCKANGHPRPTITWRRDDGSPIRLNGRLGGGHSISDEPANQTSLPMSSFAVGGSDGGSQDPNNSAIVEPPLQHTALSQLTDVKSDKLSMKSVDRFMAGIYVCTASNGIPSQVSKRIPLYVKFSPKTSISNKYISVSVGDGLEIDCIIEAFPKANSYWSKRSLLPSLQDDRRHWGDSARWLHSNGRATLYRAKQILPPSPVDDTQERTTPVDDSSDILNFNATRGDKEQLILDRTSAFNSNAEARSKQQQQQSSNADTDMMMFNSKADLISSFGGNFRGSLPIVYSSSSTQQGRTASSVVVDQVSSPPSSSKDYVTVRQTPLNTFTYKLRLSIAQMQADDYGEYTCVSTNSMGTSESKVMVTKADKIVETVDRQSTTGSDYRSLGEDDYERDSVADQARPSTTNNHQHTTNYLQQQSSVRRGSPHGGNRVVYDGNYLQAIKSRQSNLLGPNRLQQKENLKLRQFSDKSSARSAYCARSGSVWQISVILSLVVAMWSLLAAHL